MAKLKFGAWIPTYAWADRSGGAKNVRNIRESIERCEKHGIDVWGRLPEGIDLMRSLREQFDPKRTINPGRFAGYL